MPWLPRDLSGKAIRRTSARSGSVVVRGNNQSYASTWSTERALNEAMSRVTWVFRSIDAIASNQARIPILLRKDDPETGTEINKHPLLPVLNNVTNVGENAWAFRYRLSSQLLLSSRGVFIEVVRNRSGEPLALVLLPPSSVEPIKDRKLFVSGYKLATPGEQTVTLPPNDVVWIRKPHPIDPYGAITPLEAAGLAVEMDWLAKLYNRNFLINDGRPGGLIVVKGLISEEDKDDLRSRYRGNINTAGRIGVIASEEGADFVDTAITPRDAQYEQARNMTKEEILMAFGVPQSVLANAAGRCVDSETEALTQRGWLRGHEITTEDTILSMDTSTGCLTWSPIHEVYRAQYSGPMYRVKNKHLDFLVTPGHKWAMADGRLAKIEDIGERERIRTMGDAEDGNQEAVYSSAFVELVGWAVTEGYFYPNAISRRSRPNGTAPYVRICQNSGEFADRIMACLKETGARFHHVVQEDRPLERFNVRGEIASALVQVAPDRVLSTEFVLALTAEQRELLYQTMIDADGARQSSTKSIIFTQKSKRMAEAFVFLATLTGRTTSIRHEPSREGFWRYRVIVRHRKVLTLQRGTRSLEEYDGYVWCPRTDFGTFVARRNGVVTVTGNTFDNAEQERLIFWQETMRPHLQMIANPLNILTPQDNYFTVFDVSVVDVLQRAEIKRREHLLKEFAAGLITENEYRLETQRPKLFWGGDTTYIMGTNMPVGGTTKESKKRDDPEEQPDPVVPPALQPGAESDGNEPNPDDPQKPMGRPPRNPADVNDESEAQRKPNLVAAQLPHEQVVRIVVDAKAEESAPEQTTIGPWSVATSRLDEYKSRAVKDSERWESVFERTLERLLERQQRVVSQKIGGAKMRDHWQRKDIDVALVWDDRVWDSQLKDDFKPLVAGVLAEFGGDAIGSKSYIDAELERLSVVNSHMKEEIDQLLAENITVGNSVDELPRLVDEVFDKVRSDRLAEIASKTVVSAASLGRIQAAVGREGDRSVVQKVWITADHHTKRNGATVGVDDSFEFDGKSIPYPGAEDESCHCTLLVGGQLNPLDPH